MLRKLKLQLLAPIVAALFALSACAQNEVKPGEALGTVLGGALGALAGSQIGGGKGQLAAVAVGALGGAFLGRGLGQKLDAKDQQTAAKTQQQALEKNKDGEAATWANPNKSTSGIVTPTNTYQVASGEFCREYEHEFEVDGKTEKVKGTACRQNDGSWKVIN